MAAGAGAGAATGPDTDDHFDEYNPHPYQGGYDIALTYGRPLAPSAAICYPISDAPPSSPSLPPLPVGPTPGDAVPAPEHLPPPLDYSDSGFVPQSHRPEPYMSDPHGYWPYLTPVEEEMSRWRDQSGEPGFWNQWRRAADYLFGYSQGYGERWAGTDSYGIPIYANKRHADQPLVVHVEPAKVHKPVCYETQGERVYPVRYDTLCLSSQSEGRDGSTGYEKAICIQDYPIEPAWHQRQSFDEVYMEHVDPLPKWFSSPLDERVDEIHFVGTPNYAYDRHYYEEPLHVQLEPTELISTQKLSYYEDYQTYGSTEGNWNSSSYSEPLEPFEPTWSRNPSYYGVYEEEVSPKSNWNSTYQGISEEPMPPKSNWFFPSYGENGDDSHVFESSSCAYERHYHEQPLSVQLEPFKPAWSQNPIYYDVCKDEVSPNSHQGDDYYKDIATQIFCPFQKYSDYNE